MSTSTLRLGTFTSLLPIAGLVSLTTAACGPQPKPKGGGMTSDDDDDDDDDDDTPTPPPVDCGEPGPDGFVIKYGTVYLYNGTVAERPPLPLAADERPDTLWWRDGAAWQSAPLEPDAQGCAHATGVTGDIFYVVDSSETATRTVAAVTVVESRNVDRRSRLAANSDFEWWAEPVELTFDLAPHEPYVAAGYQLHCADTGIWWDTALYPTYFSFDADSGSGPATAYVSPDSEHLRSIAGTLGHECSLTRFETVDDDMGSYSRISEVQHLDPIDLSAGDQAVPVALEPAVTTDITLTWDDASAQSLLTTSHPTAVYDSRGVWLERAVRTEGDILPWGGVLGFGDWVPDGSAQVVLPIVDPFTHGDLIASLSYSASIGEESETPLFSTSISPAPFDINDRAGATSRPELLAPPIGVTLDGQPLAFDMSDLSPTPTVNVEPAPGSTPQGYRITLSGRSEDASTYVRVISSRADFELPPGVFKTAMNYSVYTYALACHDTARPGAAGSCAMSAVFFRDVAVQ